MTTFLSRLYGFLLIFGMIGVLIFLTGAETESAMSYETKKLCSLSASQSPALVTIPSSGNYRIYWESTTFRPVAYRRRRSSIMCDEVKLREQRTNQILQVSAPWHSMFSGRVSQVGQIYISKGQYSVQAFPETATGKVVITRN